MDGCLIETLAMSGRHVLGVFNQKLEDVFQLVYSRAALFDQLSVGIDPIHKQLPHLSIDLNRLRRKSSKPVVQGTNILDGLDAGRIRCGRSSLDETSHEDVDEVTLYLPEANGFGGTRELGVGRLSQFGKCRDGFTDLRHRE